MSASARTRKLVNVLLKRRRPVSAVAKRKRFMVAAANANANVRNTIHQKPRRRKLNLKRICDLGAISKIENTQIIPFFLCLFV